MNHPLPPVKSADAKVLPEAKLPEAKLPEAKLPMSVLNPVAPTRNVENFGVLMSRLVTRAPDMPGLGCFFGRAGLGKSKSAIWGANTYRAYFVECSQFTTAKSLLTRILAEMGIAHAKGSVPDLLDMACERMAMDPSRPLIIDEAHWIAHKRFIDIARALHDLSRAPIILIGEEMLPSALEAHERIHSRMLDWVEAEPANAADLRHLAKVHARSITLGADAIPLLLERTNGNTRRIVVAINDMNDWAASRNITEITSGTYDFGRIRAHKAPLGAHRHGRRS